MSRLGTNVRLLVSREHRSALRRVFTEALRFELVEVPDMADFEAYRPAQAGEGVGSIGAFFVDPDKALEPEILRSAAWLEFEVEDPDETARVLAQMGIEPFDYVDRTHRYFAAPGGQVFRLAALRPCDRPEPA